MNICSNYSELIIQLLYFKINIYSNIRLFLRILIILSYIKTLNFA